MVDKVHTIPMKIKEGGVYPYGNKPMPDLMQVVSVNQTEVVAKRVVLPDEEFVDNTTYPMDLAYFKKMVSIGLDRFNEFVR